MDVIECLRELRKSASSSVVVGNELHDALRRPEIEHPLEAWLVATVRRVVDGELGLSLLVLAGNAGDGKSALLRRVRLALGPHAAAVRFLFDASESHERGRPPPARVADWLAAFADDPTCDWGAVGLHVAAMNTGAIVQLLDELRDRGGRQHLVDVLRRQLAIYGDGPAEAVAEEARLARVLVVDLDRRMLFPIESPGRSPWFDSMLDAVDPARQHLPKALSVYPRLAPDEGCARCAQRARCPVYANLRALQLDRVRQRLALMLLDVELDDTTHLGFRALWHLIYRCTVGGVERQLGANDDPPTCAALRLRLARAAPGPDGEPPSAAAVGEVRHLQARAQFWAEIFGEVDADAGCGDLVLFQRLRELDPVTVFSLDHLDDAIACSFSEASAAALDGAIADELGVEGPTVGVVDPGADATTHVRDAAHLASRRAYFFAPAPRPDAEDDRTKSLRAWAGALVAQRAAWAMGRPARHDELLDDVRVVIMGAFGRDDLLGVSIPWTVGPRQMVAPCVLKPRAPRQVTDPRLVLPYRGGGALLVAQGQELAAALGTYPLAIPVELRASPDSPPAVLEVTWPLFRLLRRLRQLQSFPGTVDPQRLQALERVAVRLAEQASRAEVRIGNVSCSRDEEDGFHVD
jgi:hypothetical protein